MRLRPDPRDVLWMGVGAAVLALFALLVVVFGGPPAPSPALVRKAQALDLVHRMQTGLASASEAEKSAVLAITDEASQAFADKARAETAGVERDRRELESLLGPGATQAEKGLLAEFAQRFAEFQRVDGEVLELAVQNTNLKASALAFGPAAGAVDQMSAALSRLVAANAESAAAKQVTSLALSAQIDALRIETLLPPHIAEATEARMAELEAQMSQRDQAVRDDLAGLRAIPGLRGPDDLAAAASSYDRFRELKIQILALSHANTNVRSLSLSLNEKRKVMLACHDVLTRLGEAIERAPVAGSALDRFPLR